MGDVSVSHEFPSPNSWPCWVVRFLPDVRRPALRRILPCQRSGPPLGTHSFRRPTRPRRVAKCPDNRAVNVCWRLGLPTSTACPGLLHGGCTLIICVVYYYAYISAPQRPTSHPWQDEQDSAFPPHVHGMCHGLLTLTSNDGVRSSNESRPRVLSAGPGYDSLQRR